MAKQFQRLKQLCYILPIISGIFFHVLKISIVALTQKLMVEILKVSVDHTLLEQIDDQVLGTIRESVVTSFLLMESFTIQENMAVCVGVVIIISIALPLRKAFDKYLNFMEIKRLQTRIFQKFVVESNSMPPEEASDLLYTKMASIEKYWMIVKYRDVDCITSMIVGLLLFLVLAWDLGLIALGAQVMISVVSKMVWLKLSTPWAEQRERKLAFANAQLIDSVICKEVIVSQATENEERLHLQKAINADRQEIQRICFATFCSDAITVSVFSLLVPCICLYIFFFDPTMARFFQLLFLVIGLDEVTRAFVTYLDNGHVREEYRRAKEKFCHVLGVEESILFPMDFPSLRFSSEHGPAPSISKDDDSSPRTDDSLEDAKNVSDDSSGYDEIDISKLVELTLQNPSQIDCITLKELSLGYTMQDGNVSHVIDNLNLSFALGEHYAIMGETGAGKSTVFKGLSGLIKPLGGRFIVSGMVIHPTSHWWRKQLGIVNQTSLLLNRSLRENICYGIGEKNDEEIFDALEKVHLKAWVETTLPQGLDTMIHFNGNEFSGGQRQRLQIARLLLTSRRVVLLDEFTSALDSDTTDDILRVMESFLVGKTLIMITHDVQTLCLATKTLKMKAGGKFEDVTDI